MVHDVEWSGTLFYTVTGSLDEGTFKATCMDICVMDIGTSGFTNFKDTSDIIDYRINHGLLRPGIYEGLIHSHQCMAAFFSSTDETTLIKEGSDLNHFLSLIVCNEGKYVARITRKLRKKVKAEHLITYTESLEYKTFEDANIIITKGDKKQETKVEEAEEACIEYFELNINKTEVEEPFKELNSRLLDLKRNNYKSSYKVPQTSKSTNTIGSPLPPCTSYTLPTSTLFTQEEMEDSFNFNGREEVEEDFSSPYTSLEEDNSIEFYNFEVVPPDIIRTLCIQLLTSSILSTAKSSLNLEEWVKKMDSIYERRFGTLLDSYNECRLRNWIETLIDYILGYSVDAEYENSIAKKYHLGVDYDYNDNDAFIYLYASDMITFLKKLPESVVKNMMIEALTDLMPKEYDNFRNNN